MYSIKITLSDSAAVLVPRTSQASKPMLSPCIGICELATDGFCSGCLRTSAEIGGWTQMTDIERTHVMDVLLPARAEFHAPELNSKVFNAP